MSVMWIFFSSQRYRALCSVHINNENRALESKIIYDSFDKSVHCMMWDVSKAARGGEEISSAILKWADSAIPISDVN